MNKYFHHPSSYIDDGAIVGENTNIWHYSHIMRDCTIGKSCNLGQNVVVSPGVVLGNFVKVQNNVSIYTGVVCEDYVFLGPSMVFTNVINPRSAIERKAEFKQTIVRKGASIGANATVICGIEIGEFAMIGAGSVVTKDVPPFALLYGNPARQHGWVSEFGHKLHFNAEGFAMCPESGQRYALANGKISPVQ